METYHIYIFDYDVGAIFHINTETVVYKSNAINNDGTWNFEALLSDLGFINNIEYLISEKPLTILDL